MKTRQLLSLILAFTALSVALEFVSSAHAEEEEGSSWTPEERADFRSRQSPLPLQAAVCDIVGVGVVTGMSTNRWGDIAHISVDNYWIGNPGSNTLSVSANRSALTVTNTPIVFFATSYELPHYYIGEKLRFRLLFKMPEYRQGKQPQEPWFYDNERSWFYATPENADLVAFASNLVNTAQITTNHLAFYEQVRDGVRQNPPDSRIYIDSRVTFIGCSYWMPTNLMAQVWLDPLLPNRFGDIINNYYKLETGHWLP